MSAASHTHAYPGLADAIRGMRADPDELATLFRIVEVSLRQIPGSEMAGISAVARGRVETRAATDPQVEALDRRQEEAAEGPCVAVSVTDAPVVVSHDLGVDARWPVFGPTAATNGVMSAISFKLFDTTGTLGALNLFSSRRHAFGVDAEVAGTVLAAHAGVVLAAARKQANLAVALDSRDVIGQAKGILMERYKVTDRQAFDILIAASQRTHRKLRDIAEELRTLGDLPGRTPDEHVDPLVARVPGPRPRPREGLSAEPWTR